MTKEKSHSEMSIPKSTKKEKTHFQKKLIALMYDKEITNKSLSKSIGVKEVTVAFWRTGVRVPSTQNARKLATFFNTSLEDLFGPLPSGSGT